MRRATLEWDPRGIATLFLSTLSLRRATHIIHYWSPHFSISIHALLAESDGVVLGQQVDNAHFYPRSPCGERPAHLLCQCRPREFLSTLSLRRATFLILVIPWWTTISIHALLAESDVVRVCEFVWGVSISIHALLAESDAGVQVKHNIDCYFYPRSPCGERPCIYFTSFSLNLFLSTLSLRRATFSDVHPAERVADFYPRSPCGERRQRYPFGHFGRYFYPRSPCGERLFTLPENPMIRVISIHALLAESDRRGGVPCYLDNIISIHALLAESDA